MKPSVVVPPVEDPHPQKTLEDRIVYLLPVDLLVFLRRPDHIGPESLVVEQLRELVVPPTTLQGDGWKPLLPRQDHPVTRTFLDLQDEVSVTSAVTRFTHLLKGWVRRPCVHTGMRRRSRVELGNPRSTVLSLEDVTVGWWHIEVGLRE
jgi:hypothetical protein